MPTQTALEQLQAQVPSLIPADVPRDEAIAYATPDTLQRYLRARKWNVKDAAKLLQGSFAWRHSYGPHTITLADVRTAAATGNNFCHGHDKQGRPVVYLIKRGHPGNDLDNVRLLVHNMELAGRCTPPGVDKYCVVIDLAGYSRANATPLSVSRMTLDILTNQYPERLGVSYIVNAPSLYTLAWNLLSPFLDAVTKSKIKFVSINKDTVRHRQHALPAARRNPQTQMHDPAKNALLASIDADVLLERYGGRSAFEYDVEAYEAAVEALEDEVPGKLGGAQQSRRGSMEIAAAAVMA